MKRKKRRQHKKYLILVIVVIVLTIVTGYSILSDSLSISGGAVTGTYVYGPDLNIELIPNGERYFYGIMPERAIFVSEVLENNRLVITFQKTDNNALFYTTELKIDFKNIYQDNLTKGKIKRSVPGGHRGFSVMSTSISKETLVPNETATMTIKFNFINYRATPGATMTTSLEYRVNGTTQTFYVDVVFI